MQVTRGGKISLGGEQISCMDMYSVEPGCAGQGGYHSSCSGVRSDQFLSVNTGWDEKGCGASGNILAERDK